MNTVFLYDWINKSTTANVGVILEYGLSLFPDNLVN